MDPEYLEQLMALLQGQQAYGGDGQPYDPYPQYQGLQYPQGKTPQYRSQFTDYMSDGTVRDLVMKALPNQQAFSPDAFLDVDPDLKPILARAVSEAGHDPYQTYANFDADNYQKALLQRAMGDLGLGGGGLDFGEEASIEDILGAVDDEYGDRVTKADDGLGNDRSVSTPYSQLLRQRLARSQGQLDDFFTQAAPSLERNLNNIDFAWTKQGGAPFPGINQDSLDYAGSGPAFRGGGGGDPLASYTQQMIAQYGARPAQPSRAPARPSRSEPSSKDRPRVGASKNSGGFRSDRPSQPRRPARSRNTGR